MNGLLVDANLLLVYIVGLLDEDLNENHKRTRAYCKKDWDHLRQFMIAFNPLITTPSVLTEVSNLLSGGFTGKKRESLFAIFSGVVSEVLDEKYTQSKDIVADSAFSRLGLTDIGIEKIAQSQSPALHVLTADSRLYDLLSQRGIKAHNFNHLRGKRMGI